MKRIIVVVCFMDLFENHSSRKMLLKLVDMLRTCFFNSTIYNLNTVKLPVEVLKFVPIIFARKCYVRKYHFCRIDQ